MITTLEDFLRRRSNIALTVRRRDLAASRGLMRACQILFGAAAQAQYVAYFQAEQGGR